jgi:hypothetical protein
MISENFTSGKIPAFFSFLAGRVAVCSFAFGFVFGFGLFLGFDLEAIVFTSG